MTTVGVLGIGRMGGAMARSLSRGGFSLLLYNRTPDRASALAAELGGDARACATPAEVARGADLTISMVSDDVAVAELYTGADGLLGGVHPGLVVVDMSTVLPGTILGLEREVRARGAGLLDAPVSGSVSLAESGGLTVMAGGTAEDLEKARPAFDALARSVFHLGPLGSGAAMKLAVNAVIFGLNQALAEGIVLAEKAGIERSKAYDVLAASAVGAPYVGYKRDAFLAPDSTPPAFSIGLASKDLRLIGELAQSVGARMPQAAVNLESLRAAAATLGGEADFSAVAVDLRGAGEQPGGPGPNGGSMR